MQWTNQFLSQRIFHQQGREIIKETYEWDNVSGSWTKRSYSTYDYDESGNWIDWIRKWWDAEKMQYLPSNRRTARYNDHHQVLEVVRFKWNAQSESWEHYNSQELYEYDN